MIIKNNIPEISVHGSYKAKVDSFPVSVNHQYVKTKTGSLYLKKEVSTFRTIFGYQASNLRSIPKNSILSVELIFASNKWLNKNGSIKKKDLDNLIKGTLDAMVCLGIRDENIFELTAKKILHDSKTDVIYIGILDLGQTITYHNK